MVNKKIKKHIPIDTKIISTSDEITNDVVPFDMKDDEKYLIERDITTTPPKSSQPLSKMKKKTVQQMENISVDDFDIDMYSSVEVDESLF